MRVFILSILISATCFAETPFYLGADISTLGQVEKRGGVYRDNGVPGDAISIFMKHGCTCFRLRLWVNPRAGANGLPYTVELAKRIKKAGGAFMLDFHYSDTWADPQHQVKPAAWSKMEFDDLVKQSQDYTTDAIKTFAEADATPDMVQIGNEITGGLFWPDAQVKVPPSAVKVMDGSVQVITPPEPYDDAKQWARLIQVIKANAAGVRAATPGGHVKIIIHIDCGGDWLVTQWYMDHLGQANVDFDILGQSYYPIYHGTIENLRDNLRETINKYHKDVMVVETGYPSRTRRLTPAQQKNMIWAMSPEGQKAFLAEVIRTVKAAPEGRGIGVNYWHPESVNTGATTRPNPDVNSLFNGQGNALPAMDVLNSLGK